jgi:hypothetical protein
MAQKAPQAPQNRRTTYQAAGARSTGKGSVVTTSGRGSTTTINPGAQRKARPKAAARPKPVNRRAQENKQAREQRKHEAAQARQRRERAAGRRRAAQAPGKAAGAVTRRGRYSAGHMLTAELIAGVIIVAVRAVADYEPQADGTLKGKVGHPKGQYGPLPVLAGLIVSFFLLSFLAASGGLKAKLAVIAGAIIDLGLLMNSSDEFVKVSSTFGTFGKAKLPAGSWQTEGTAAGEPISGTLPSTGGGGSGSGGGGGGLPKGAPPGAVPVGAGGSCPAGTIKEGAGPKGPFWCMPTEG